VLDPAERSRIAAEDGAATLTRKPRELYADRGYDFDEYRRLRRRSRPEQHSWGTRARISGWDIEHPEVGDADRAPSRPGQP
jgi:hypothetical protein